MVDPQQVTSFVAGILSGVTKLAVGHPFDTIKVRMQTSTMFSSPTDCFLRTVKLEGFRALYKGYQPPLIGWAFMDSIMYGSLSNFRYLLKDKEGNLTLFRHGIAGMFAGWTVSFVATPIELIKSKLQVQYYTKTYDGPVDCAMKLVKNNGVKALWTGLVSTLIFRSWFFVLWGSYQVYSDAFAGRVGSQWIPFLAGGCAANTFWLCSFPFDVVKNRIMTASRKRTYMDTVREIYSTNGIRGFYRGFLPCMLRSFPTNGAAILVFEFSVKHMSNSVCFLFE